MRVCFSERRVPGRVRVLIGVSSGGGGSSASASPASFRVRTPRLTPILAIAAAALVVLLACGNPTGVARHRIRSSDLKRVTLGQTTADQVERLFGAPDERGPDGSLVYRAPITRADAPARTESVTFRFESGVLSKICRDRRS